MLRIVFFALLLVACGAWCCELKDAIRHAISNNSGILSAKEHMYAAKIRHRGGISSFLPTVTASLQSNSLSVGDFVDPVFNLQARQNIFSYGKGSFDLGKAYSEYRTQENALNDITGRVVVSVVISYLNLLKLQKTKILYKEMLAAMEANFNAEKMKFSLGSANKSDLSQMKAKLSAANARYIRAQSEEKNAVANFIHLVGMRPDKMSFPKDEYVNDLPGSIENATQLAKNSNAKLRVAYYKKEALEFSKLSAISAALPAVDLIVGYSAPFYSADVARRSFTIGLSSTLFQGGAGYANLMIAKYMANHGSEEYKEAHKSLDEEMTIAWNDYQNAFSLISAANDSVDSYNVALSNVKEEAALNLKTSIDVVDAEIDLLKSKIELIEAQNAKVVSTYRLITMIYSNDKLKDLFLGDIK